MNVDEIYKYPFFSFLFDNLTRLWLWQHIQTHMLGKHNSSDSDSLSDSSKEDNSTLAKLCYTTFSWKFKKKEIKEFFLI